jgi:ion channel-forming bestrophin family protein|nr:bestrophin family ion channel [uncultured Flavobacterium sp.]
MIIKKKTHWFKMLFEWQGSVLPQLLPRLLLIFVYTGVLVYFQDVLLRHHLHINPAIFTVFGIALAIFLGFRNTVSYERFWEGRKLWGALLNDTRSLARQAHNLFENKESKEEISLFVNRLIALVYALKHQLRHTNAGDDMKRLLPEGLAGELEHNRLNPVILLKSLGGWVQENKQGGNITPLSQLAFEENFNKVSDIIGGCERIANTPIPFSYSVLLHRTVYIYCFMLPFGFVDTLGWLTPFILVFIAYTFLALEAIADELEDPFGTQPNDLALDTMASVIEDTLLEIDGRKPPERTIPNDYYVT